MKTAGGLGVAKKLFVGLDSNIYGLTVGRGAGAVASNTAVGASALAANTSGNYNSAFGNLALYTNITGQYNTAIGQGSLYLNTGSLNTAVGVSSLQNNSSGASNTAQGYQALYSNTTASASTAVGYQAGYSNTTGLVTGFGYQALYSQTTANGNSAFGNQALRSTTTGSSNTAFGETALFSNTTASYNTAVGYQAGYAVQTGQFNAYFGATTGSAATGDSNSFFGIGSGAAVTSGAKNTIIGRYNGNQSGLDIHTASNYIVLSDGDGNPRGVCFSTGGWTFSNGGTSDVVGARSGNTAGTANSLYVGYYSATGPTNGTLSFNVTTNGNVTNTNNSYGSLSDIKLKENIVDASPKLADMMQVRVVNYNFKEGQTHKQIGVIAQELEQVFPGMVDESPDRDEEGNDLGTTTKQVKYSVFVPMLIKAIQELKAEVDSLKAQLNGASA
jgi:hypothetical protein